MSPDTDTVDPTQAPTRSYPPTSTYAVDPIDHLGLAHRAVNDLLRRRPDLERWRDDLRSAAYVQLCRSAQTFDADRGLQPSTHLLGSVEKHLRRDVARLCWVAVREPFHMGARSLDTKRSLDESIGDGEGEDHPWIDAIDSSRSCHPPSSDPIERLEARLDAQRELSHLIDRAGLTDRELRVLQRRVVDGMTLADVGHELGLSKERIRQIARDALEKLRCAAGLVDDGVSVDVGLTGALGNHERDRRHQYTFAPSSRKTSKSSRSASTPKIVSASTMSSPTMAPQLTQRASAASAS